MAFLDTGNIDHNEIAASTNAQNLYELGLIYATGRNCEVDVVAAHKWLNIAAYRGLEIAKQRREELATEMSREQIAQAQREARDWITQH